MRPSDERAGAKVRTVQTPACRRVHYYCVDGMRRADNCISEPLKGKGAARWPAEFHFVRRLPVVLICCTTRIAIAGQDATCRRHADAHLWLSVCLSSTEAPGQDCGERDAGKMSAVSILGFPLERAAQARAAVGNGGDEHQRFIR